MVNISPAGGLADDPLRLGRADRRIAVSLFDQQLWNFGCDARRADNPLSQFGFVRHRAAVPRNGSSAYCLCNETRHEHIVLWAFGAYHGDTGTGVFIRRFTFAPRLAFLAQSFECVHTPADLRVRTATRTNAGATHQRGVMLLMQHFASYEGWILQSYRVDYRERCLRERRPRERTHSVSPASVPRAWCDLVSDYAVRHNL